MPTRWDPAAGPSERVAVVLPGSGYSPSHPLLEFGRQALLQHGWTVQQVWWDQPDDDRDDDAWVRWVCEQARAAAEREQGASKLLFLGKSLGTALYKPAMHWGSIQGDAESYVRTAMYDQNISWWRRRRHVRETALVGVDRAAPVVDDEARVSLRDALMLLTARQRTVLVLRYFEDLWRPVPWRSVC